ncbi:MAG TPA: RES domain-containing protein [Bryobacteraceae bacterium]|nr:RES domain-containing protein [Bryobacteraceae bacterium]
MKTVFRLCSKRYPANDGKGAALKGGRWNPAGTAVIYSSATASLAALEVLASYSALPRDFTLTEIRIPETL